MVLDHLQKPQRPHAKGEGHRAAGHPQDSIQGQGQGSPGKNTGRQQDRQAQVAKGAGDQPGSKEEQDEARYRLEKARPGRRHRLCGYLPKVP